MGAEYRTAKELYRHSFAGTCIGISLNVILNPFVFISVIGQICAHLDKGYTDRTMGKDGPRPVPDCIPEYAIDTG